MPRRPPRGASKSSKVTRGDRGHRSSISAPHAPVIRPPTSHEAATNFRARFKPMSKNNWLVVAHRAGARIFCRGDAPHSLECVARFEHPQAHLHEREFGSDRPGRATVSSRAGRHAMTNETPASETSLRMFAERIADYLETARLDHRLERLSLVAEPHMLGPVACGTDYRHRGHCHRLARQGPGTRRRWGPRILAAGCPLLDLSAARLAAGAARGTT